MREIDPVVTHTKKLARMRERDQQGSMSANPVLHGKSGHIWMRKQARSDASHAIADRLTINLEEGSSLRVRKQKFNQHDDEVGSAMKRYAGERNSGIDA